MDWTQQVNTFMPHGMCLLWRPGLLALHVISDAIIAASYFAIPIVIAVFVRRRSDLDRSHRAIALLFAAFITLCGWTHLASILVLWRPVYLYEGWLKAVTAAVSLATAGSLPFLVPHLLRVPSPRALQREVEAHRSTLEALDAARAALAHRVDHTESELRVTNRRFEAALRHSSVTVYEQDEDLRYTWAYNTQLGIDADSIIGASELDAFDAGTANAVRELKIAALAERSPQHGEVVVSANGKSGWFEVRVEPMELSDGRFGLVGTATDVTARKAHEAHLQMLMREMNHRSKNVLAMVMGIARQTGRGMHAPEAFVERLSERLAALASAHDVLAKQDWRGADLLAVLEGQLKHHIDTFGERIEIDGEACELPPAAAHYVGLALHELGSNAVKHGALAGPRGTVSVSWTVTPTPEGQTLDLNWRESGGPPALAPVQTGFGMTLLKSLVARALGGESEISFEPPGLAWRLYAPLRAEELAA